MKQEPSETTQKTWTQSFSDVEYPLRLGCFFPVIKQVFFMCFKLLLLSFYRLIIFLFLASFQAECGIIPLSGNQTASGNFCTHEESKNSGFSLFNTTSVCRLVQAAGNLKTELSSPWSHHILWNQQKAVTWITCSHRAKQPSAHAASSSRLPFFHQSNQTNSIPNIRFPTTPRLGTCNSWELLCTNIHERVS